MRTVTDRAQMRNMSGRKSSFLTGQTNMWKGKFSRERAECEIFPMRKPGAGNSREIVREFPDIIGGREGFRLHIHHRHR